MQIYVHRPRQETVFFEAANDAAVQELLDEHGGGQAWLENQEEPLAPEATLREVGVSDRAHVHVGSCKRVHVRVRYAGKAPIEHDFPPATTIEHVFQWATGKHGFELTETERAKHTLGICDTSTEADRSDHVGTFADEECRVCFDLAPKERFEG